MAEPRPSDAPRLLVISGPSGAGKTSVAQRLLEDPRFGRAVTRTTRAPRGEERPGLDYEFVSEAEFEASVADGELLEHAEVYGDRYGAPRKNVERILLSGRHCVLVVDVQGAAAIRDLGVDAVSVFVKTADLADLEARLRGRGEDNEAAIATRLEAARRELLEEPRFDVVVVNDRVENAARRLAARLEIELEAKQGD